jgi:tRNA threonylcarbamoyladenosine modification (KEOPS) complex  Pcc1 subunit
MVVSDQSDNKENNSNNKTSRIKINEDYVKVVLEISKSDYQSLKT